MNKAIILLISIILLFSCDSIVKLHVNANGSPKIFKTLPIHWRFDCEFPEENKPVVRDAFDYWQGLIKNKIFIEDQECNYGLFFSQETKVFGIGITQFEFNEETFINNKKVNLWGRASIADFGNDSLSGLIVFFPVWDIEPSEGIRESIARHEIGHVLGFYHSTDESCLMYETVSTFEIKKTLCGKELLKFKELYERK